jgi:hypothetical protein
MFQKEVAKHVATVRKYLKRQVEQFEFDRRFIASVQRDVQRFCDGIEVSDHRERPT